MNPLLGLPRLKRAPNRKYYIYLVYFYGSFVKYDELVTIILSLAGVLA